MPKRLVLRFLLPLIALGLAIAAGYVLYLDAQITGTFQGRLWSVPARVYAQPLNLFKNASLSANDLNLELARLGYLGRPGDNAGTFTRKFTALGQQFDINLRSFQFSDKFRPAMKISLLLRAEKIISLVASDQSNIPLIRMEAPLIGSIFPSHGEDRIVLAPTAVPDMLRDTLITVEDQNFKTHQGFDLAGIVRAAWVNLQAGKIKQGGSTLTQQLVKSYFLNNERTFSRKLKELVMAVILDARFSKQDLINAYINEIYLGQDGARAIHGFGLGSQYYFNKPVSELAAHEIALLVTVIRGPSFYNPRRNPQRALERRDRVLGQMRSAGIIGQDIYEQGLRKPIASTATARKGGAYYPAFMDLVRKKLSEEYERETLSSHGYHIFTTLNPRIQEAAQDAVVQTLLTIEQQGNLRPGELQAAVLVSNAQTGELQAVVGARDAGFQGFNRALNARRPIGSLIKPVVYLTALETPDFHLLSPLNDAPVAPIPDQIKTWSPKNFNGRVNGQVPLLRAMSDSLNLATANLGLKLGVQTVAGRFAELTQQKHRNRFPSFLLGAVEMSPLQVNELYGVFASGGFHTPARTVIEVIDETGQALSRYPFKIKQLIQEKNVTQINELMQVVMRYGTGKTSRFGATGVAGKTGTSDQSRDSWFVGFDDRHLTVVWLGYDDNRASNITGSSAALKVWDALASDLNVSALSKPVLADFHLVTVDYNSGKRANADCSDNLVDVSVPVDIRILTHRGCANTLRDLGEKVKRWFKN